MFTVVLSFRKWMINTHQREDQSIRLQIPISVSVSYTTKMNETVQT